MTKKNIASYTAEYLIDYGFEAEMVRYRRQLVLERLHHYRPKRVVEVGCGSDLQAQGYWDEGGRWDMWSIVEPSQAFSDHAKASALTNLHVIQGFFEDVADQVASNSDVIICSGLLHEVPDADKLMSAIRRKMGPETILHVNVPNALSMHRQLAKSMGLIGDLKSLSARNSTLQQPRVYDLSSLVSQLETCGLLLVSSGGYFMKPFTHKQMEPLVEDLGRNVMDGLYELGKVLPDLASELFVEAKVA